MGIVALLAPGLVVYARFGADRPAAAAQLRFWLGRRRSCSARRHLRLADEERVAALFLDCDRGAVPALGMVWGLQTVVDDGLEFCHVVYFECGDHERLLKVAHATSSRR